MKKLLVLALATIFVTSCNKEDKVAVGDPAKQNAQEEQNEVTTENLKAELSATAWKIYKIQTNDTDNEIKEPITVEFTSDGLVLVSTSTKPPGFWTISPIDFSVITITRICDPLPKSSNWKIIRLDNGFSFETEADGIKYYFAVAK